MLDLEVNFGSFVLIVKSRYCILLLGYRNVGFVEIKRYCEEFLVREVDKVG